MFDHWAEGAIRTAHLLSSRISNQIKQERQTEMEIEPRAQNLPRPCCFLTVLFSTPPQMLASSIWHHPEENRHLVSKLWWALPWELKGLGKKYIYVCVTKWTACCNMLSFTYYYFYLRLFHPQVPARLLEQSSSNHPVNTFLIVPPSFCWQLVCQVVSHP